MFRYILYIEYKSNGYVTNKTKYKVPTLTLASHFLPIYPLKPLQNKDLHFSYFEM